MLEENRRLIQGPKETQEGALLWKLRHGDLKKRESREMRPGVPSGSCREEIFGGLGGSEFGRAVEAWAAGGG